MKSTVNNPNITLVFPNCGVIVVKSIFERFSGVGVLPVNPSKRRRYFSAMVQRFNLFAVSATCFSAVTIKSGCVSRVIYPSAASIKYGRASLSCPRQR